jgi:hypothetical protein
VNENEIMFDDREKDLNAILELDRKRKGYGIKRIDEKLDENGSKPLISKFENLYNMYQSRKENIKRLPLY